MAEDKAPNSIVPPAGEKHAASKETVLGEETAEGIPRLTSAPATGEKVQAAMLEIPDPKTDDTVNAPTADEKEKELKEKSPVGGAEAEAIAGSGEKPGPAETVEGAKEDKKQGGQGTEPSGASKPEEPEAAKPKEAPAANGPAGKEEPAKEAREDAPTGGKRAAVTNGGKADGPAKKAKTGAAPTTNGGGRPRGKREKKQPPPVGQTARRTRSQGLGA